MTVFPHRMPLDELRWWLSRYIAVLRKILAVGSINVPPEDGLLQRTLYPRRSSKMPITLPFSWGQLSTKELALASLLLAPVSFTKLLKNHPVHHLCSLHIKASVCMSRILRIFGLPSSSYLLLSSSPSLLPLNLGRPSFYPLRVAYLST